MKILKSIGGTLTICFALLFPPKNLLAGELKGVEQIIAEGKEIYVQHCQSCHGDKLQGQPNFRQRLPNGKMPAPAHDATGHTWHHADWQLLEMTKTGRQPFRPSNYKTDMPAYKDKLSDAEIMMVLVFIKSTWPENIQRRQAEITKNTLR